MIFSILIRILYVVEVYEKGHTVPVHEKTLHSVRLGDKSHGSINYIKKQNENRTQWDFVNGHYRSASHVFAAEKRQTFLNISTI